MSKTFQPDSLHPYIMDARLKKATGSGGISNIPIASADTLGVVKAGDGVSIDAAGAISGIAYSTTEHKTGRKWIDDKDIYEKVVPINLTTIEDDSTVVATGYNFVETLIHSVFIAIKVNNRGCEADCAYVNADGELKIHNLERWTELIGAYVIIQYTKTTP